MNPIKIKLLSQDECNTINNELQTFEKNNNFHYSRVDNSPAFSNPPIGVKMLHELQDTISQSVGKDLLPTYSYGRIYKTGNVLPKHVDREASEFGVSITTQSDIEWPMFWEHDGEEIEESADVGEALIYKGSKTPHWRKEYKGKQQIQLLLFYVDSEGVFSHLHNDKFVGTSLNKTKPNL